jgi:single-strand DNA-binding protein
MHKIILIGNLGSDPEQREVGWNSATHFSVAVNERWTNSEGERETRTIWYQVTAWGKLGEVCAEHLQKGRKVYVEGRLVPDKDTGNPRAWLRDDGTPAAAYDLRAESIEFLDNAADRTPEMEAESSPDTVVMTEE